MKIDRICYEQLFPTGVYANQRLRAEVLLEKGDNPQEAFELARDTVSKAFSALNVGMSEYFSTPQPIEQKEPDQPLTRDQEIAGYMEMIKTASENELKLNRNNILRINDNGLTESFLLKLKSLQSK